MNGGRNLLSFLDEFDREGDTDDDQDVRVDLTPAIDVLFSILAFFIVATLFFARLRGLPVNLPEAATAPAVPAAALTVTVDRAGTVSVEGTALSLPDLQQLARSRQTSAGQSLQAIVAADRETPHGRVIAVMDALRQVPGVRLAVATVTPAN